MSVFLSSCARLLTGCLISRLITLTTMPPRSHVLWTQGWLTLQEATSVHGSHQGAPQVPPSRRDS